MYTTLAKLLANMLRSVIVSVIFESETAFVKDRQILDGILIVNEEVDEACKSSKELMLFKVDFEKIILFGRLGILRCSDGANVFPVFVKERD
jgi:hypothetical protein